MRFPEVTIVGAGQVGASAAYMLLAKGLANVTMIDVAEGLPQGKALDMMHARSIEHFGPRIKGTNDYAMTAGSDLVVITAGLPRKPGMTRDDLLAANSSIVRSVVEQVVAASPDALIMVVTNPLDVMVYLAWQVSGLDSSRVFGMGGVLDSARFEHAIADHLGVEVASVKALACGSHGDAMVPLPSQASVDGVPLAQMLSADEVDRIVQRTVFGGAEVVGLLKTGSAFYAPAASIVRTVEAIFSDTPVVLPSCVRLSGQYGVSDVYMSVPAVIDREGVKEIIELDVTADEARALKASADTIVETLVSLGLRE